MYKISHTYYHPQGDALARHLLTFPNRQRLNECWYIDGATPVIKMFANKDRSYCEVFWIWKSKEQYQKWLDSTPDWDHICEIGLINSKEQGVHQEHIVPDKEDVLMPTEGLEPVTQLLLEFEYHLKCYTRQAA
jgi:hypothetical protein